MTLLQNRLALHRFICLEFGYDDMSVMLERLGDAPAEVHPGGESEYARALYLNPGRAQVTLDQLAEYDANITAHSQRLRMTGEQGRTWKPHQYLALLFTEHYLRRYFDDPEELRADLNEAKARHRPTFSMPDYVADDLRTLAFQSATGSGKTLLMHAHVHGKFVLILSRVAENKHLATGVGGWHWRSMSLDGVVIGQRGDDF